MREWAPNGGISGTEEAVEDVFWKRDPSLVPPDTYCLSTPIPLTNPLALVSEGFAAAGERGNKEPLLASCWEAASALPFALVRKSSSVRPWCRHSKWRVGACEKGHHAMEYVSHLECGLGSQAKGH